MSKDTRVPVDVTQIGRVTVRIYDMEEYQRNIQAYQNVPVIRRSAKKEARVLTSFPKQKPTARYSWHSRLHSHEEIA